MTDEKFYTNTEIVVIDNELYYSQEYVEFFDDEKIPEFRYEFHKVPEKDIKELGLDKMTLN